MGRLVHGGVGGDCVGVYAVSEDEFGADEVPEAVGVGEDVLAAGGEGQPRLLGHFRLKLPGPPAGVSREEPGLAARLAEKRGDHSRVAGKADAGGDFRTAVGGCFVVEDDHDGGFAGAALVDDSLPGGILADDLPREGDERHGQGPVEHQSEGAFVAVQEHEDDGAVEIRVAEALGGDEKFSAQAVH